MIEQPTSAEAKLIARCLMENGILIGSQEDIWTHPSAFRALGTWKECIDAITLLIGGNHAVRPSFIKSCVMQADGISSVPFCLDEIAEFLVEDNEARLYWQSRCNDDMYPHKCHKCGCAAYIGFLTVECKAKCVNH